MLDILFGMIRDFFTELPHPGDEAPMSESPLRDDEGIVKTIIEPDERCFHQWEEVPESEWNARLYGKRTSLISEGWPRMEHRRAFYCVRCSGQIVAASVK